MKGKRSMSFAILVIFSVVSFAVIIYGQKVLVDEKYCSVDADCACGTNVRTQQCFYGNKNYVGAKQCPDFCSGFAGNLEIKCVKSECVQIKR